MAKKKDTTKTPMVTTPPDASEKVEAPKVQKLNPELFDGITAENKLAVIEELEKAIAFVKETGDKDTELLLSKLMKVAKDK
jgi:hypothetical protein